MGKLNSINNEIIIIIKRHFFFSIVTYNEFIPFCAQNYCMCILRSTISILINTDSIFYIFRIVRYARMSQVLDDLSFLNLRIKKASYNKRNILIGLY